MTQLPTRPITTPQDPHGGSPGATEPRRTPVPPKGFYVLVDKQGRCGCCRAVGDHPCGHECDSCDGSGRNPDSPICTLPHGGDCTCTEAQS